MRLIRVAVAVVATAWSFVLVDRGVEATAATSTCPQQVVGVSSGPNVGQVAIRLTRPPDNQYSCLHASLRQLLRLPGDTDFATMYEHAIQSPLIEPGFDIMDYGAVDVFELGRQDSETTGLFVDSPPPGEYCYLGVLGGDTQSFPYGYVPQSKPAASCAVALTQLPDPPAAATVKVTADEVVQVAAVSSDPGTPFIGTVGPIADGKPGPCQCWSDVPGAIVSLDLSDPISALLATSAAPAGFVAPGVRWRLLIDDAPERSYPQPTGIGFDAPNLQVAAGPLGAGRHTVKLQFKVMGSCGYDACPVELPVWSLHVSAARNGSVEEASVSALGQAGLVALVAAISGFLLARLGRLRSGRAIH